MLLVALQLLAACYTLLPSTSATHVPLTQQRKEPGPATALRACSKYRFSPAAGHHARPSSETASWPDLYTGPSIEERLAEHVSHQRRRQKHHYEHTPSFAGSGWTDGPPPVATRTQSRRSLSPASSSSSDAEPGFFSKLICQAAIPKNYQRKHNTMFFSRLSLRSKRQKQLQAEEESHYQDEEQSDQDFSAQPVQRIPSALRLRLTQSAPRMVAKEVPIQKPRMIKRHSSDPSIGSPLEYPFQIPEIHRVSATTSGSWYPDSSAGGSVRACGRGDLITAHDYFDDDSPDTPYTPRKQQRQWTTPRWRHKYTGADSLLEAAALGQSMEMNDYFGPVHIGAPHAD